jgi:glycosyltransferase involved in cell wall biosynthesis
VLVEGLVTTIIPVHNRPVLVREAIESVLAQTYRQIEIVVVDDGSTDDTRQSVVDIAKSHPNIRLVSQQNSGPGPARQKGLDAARGEFIQFLDSDDLLSDTKFSMQVEALRKKPTADIAYGKTTYLKKSGEMIRPWLKTGKEIATLLPEMLAGRFWGTSTPLYRSILFSSSGRFEALLNEEDWEMDCRIGVAGTRLAWVDEWASTEREIAERRASSGGSSDPTKLKDRVKARELILQHACEAGVSADAIEFKAFIDSSFLVARQAALVGLENESAGLIQKLNMVDSDIVRKAYFQLGKVFGFKNFTQIAEATRLKLKKDAARR